MTNRTKLALVAALIAVFATPALAKDHANYSRHQYRNGYVTQAPGLYEGRNAAVFGEPTYGTSTDRESLVRAN